MRPYWWRLCNLPFNCFTAFPGSNVSLLPSFQINPSDTGDVGLNDNDREAVLSAKPNMAHKAW